MIRSRCADSLFSLFSLFDVASSCDVSAHVRDQRLEQPSDLLCRRVEVSFAVRTTFCLCETSVRYVRSLRSLSIAKSSIHPRVRGDSSGRGLSVTQGVEFQQSLR